MMSKLLDFPDELLLQIVQCLHEEADEDEPDVLEIINYNKPLMDSWPPHDETLAGKLSKRNARLLNTLMTCRRLYGITASVLYQHVSLNSNPKRLVMFTREINVTAFSGNIKTVNAAFGDGDTSLLPLFQLPNLQALRLRFCTDNTHKADSEAYYGRSNVSNLHLDKCVATQDALTSLLRYPRALKQLTVQLDQVLWDHTGCTGMHNSTEEPFGGPCFDNIGLKNACSVHALTLEKLVLTNASQTWLPGPRTSFVQFHALKHLKIGYYILTGNDGSTDIHEILPRTLQVLEVYHYTLTIFSARFPDTFSRWKARMKALAGKKCARLPELKTVSICAGTEMRIKSFEETTEAEAEEQFIKTREDFRSQFAKVGVSFSAGLLNEEGWYVENDHSDAGDSSNSENAPHATYAYDTDEYDSLEEYFETCSP